MLQTIGQVREWVLDKIEIHEMAIAGGQLFSATDIANRGAIAALKVLLEALEGSQEAQGEVLVNLRDPEVIESLRKRLDSESTYLNDADVANDPRR